MALVERTIEALRAAGLDARKVANYQGACKAPYLVVQDGGERATGKVTCRRAVVVYGFAPHGQSALLRDLLSSAEAALRALPALRLTAVSEETIDDAFQAITSNMTYTALCAK